MTKPLAHFFRFPASPHDAERAKLVWLIRLRWLAIAFFFVLTAPALLTGLLSHKTVPMFLGIVSVLLVFNLLTQLTVSEATAALNPLWICFQMAFDLAMLTGLLLLTGGFGNPFTPLFLLNVALGGLLIPGRLSWPFLFLAHALLGFLQLHFVTENPGAVDGRLIATFLTSHLLTFSFWVVSRSLGAHLERQFKSQAQARVLFEKQDRLRAVGALAAGFSHEFASPLNAAKIRLERAARERGSEDISEALDAVRTCEHVVRQMNASQLDSRDFNFKNVVVADLLNDVIESWREEHPEISVRLRLSDTSRGRVPPVNFAQVILNLLDNAAEAAPAKAIDVALEGSKDFFCLRIADQGPGFPTTILNRLGEPFMTSKPDGTGLGLYVSQLFCQSLGGSLEAKNRDPETGAILQLQWPKQEERS